MKRHYPDFMKAYLQYTSNHESTKRLQLWTCISVIAGALERKVWIDRGYYTLFPNLYVMIIARSGLVKKSTSTAIGVNLLKQLDNINFLSERLTAASLVDQMSNSYKVHDVPGGEDYQHCSLFAYGSELAVMMGEVHGSIIELLTTFSDCIPHDSNLPWVNKAKHENQIKIYGPCLNILGASTKEWLYKAIPDKEMAGGFASRCVFVVENNGPTKLVAWPEVNEDMVEMGKKLVDDLHVINQLYGSYKVSSEVRAKFTKWYEHHMNEIVAKNEDNRFSGYLSRKGDLLLKLSIIRAASKSNDMIITEEDFDWAGKNIEAIEPDMMHAFHKKKGRDGEKTVASDLFVYLQSQGRTSREKLASKFGLKPNQASQIMTGFIETGKVRVEMTPKGEFYSVVTC